MSSSTGRSTVVKFGSNYIMQLDAKPGVLFWTQPLAIDADGHPQAYHPQGSPPGLDYLANAGSPGNWWGIATHDGTSSGSPIIQSVKEPASGFYVSTTAQTDPARKPANPACYVHSAEIPFIVLPGSPKFSPAQKLGDLCMVFNNANGKLTWACYSDIGPSNQLGEGSMALAAALGISDDPKTGGTDQETLAVIYWPGSSLGFPSDPEECQITAYQLFEDWGGYESASAALPQFDWTQFPDITPMPPPAPTDLVVTVTAPPGVTVKVIQQ